MSLRFELHGGQNHAVVLYGRSRTLQLIGLKYSVLSTGVLLGEVQESHFFFHCFLDYKLPFCRRARADLNVAVVS